MQEESKGAMATPPMIPVLDPPGAPTPPSTLPDPDEEEGPEDPASPVHVVSLRCPQTLALAVAKASPIAVATASWKAFWKVTTETGPLVFAHCWVWARAKAFERTGMRALLSDLQNAVFPSATAPAAARTMASVQAIASESPFAIANPQPFWWAWGPVQVTVIRAPAHTREIAVATDLAAPAARPAMQASVWKYVLTMFWTSTSRAA